MLKVLNINKFIKLNLGCNLTREFRECAHTILKRQEEDKSQCVVSSCLIKAGAGICDQPDVAMAIENNLGCVFKQVTILK